MFDVCQKLINIDRRVLCLTNLEHVWTGNDDDELRHSVLNMRRLTVTFLALSGLPC